jgi:hypothetical protein
MDYFSRTLCDNIGVDKKTSDGRGFDSKIEPTLEKLRI